jgi:esterase/lipase
MSETHRIETEDGYQLKVHRVLPRVMKERKGPVLLMHGLFGTSADFVLTGPNIGLGKFD